jgi:hypothetical protein
MPAVMLLRVSSCEGDHRVQKVPVAVIELVVGARTEVFEEARNYHEGVGGVIPVRADRIQDRDAVGEVLVHGAD